MAIIGIDLHETIDSNPKFFQNMMKKMIEKFGDTIYVITGATTREAHIALTEMKLKKNVHYHNIISVVDFLDRQGTKFTQDENGNLWCDEDDWWKSKSRICLMYNIEVLIDDKVKYLKHINEDRTTKLLWNKETQTATQISESRLTV